MACDKLVDVGRRQFLRGGAIATVGAAATAALPANRAEAKAGLARVDYPSKKLSSVSALKVNVPVEIQYPDAGSPGVLLKLGTKVEGGVGPDGDIVAFSTLCPHKGWALSYNAGDKTLNCPGHHSRFDCEAGGQQTFTPTASMNSSMAACRTCSEGG